IYALKQLGERLRVRPFVRYFSGNRPQLAQPKRLDSTEPGLKRLPSAHAVIDEPVCIGAAEVAIREIPFFSVEAVAEVDEMSAEFSVSLAAEHNLPSVTVAQPLVEREDTSEFLPVFNLVEG